MIRRVARLAGADPEDLRWDVDRLARVLAHPAAFEEVFGGRDEHGGVAVSPFLMFAVVVHRGWDELHHVGHVDEWVGLRRRLPVLGATDLRDFLGSADIRLFITELLASYRGGERRRLGAHPPGLAAAPVQRARPGALGVAAGGRPRRGAARRVPPARRPRLVPHRCVPRSHRTERAGASRRRSPPPPQRARLRTPAGLDRWADGHRRSARTTRPAVVPAGGAHGKPTDRVDAGGRGRGRQLRSGSTNTELPDRPPSLRPPRRLVRRAARRTPSAQEPSAVKAATSSALNSMPAAATFSIRGGPANPCRE